MPALFGLQRWFPHGLHSLSLCSIIAVARSGLKSTNSCELSSFGFCSSTLGFFSGAQQAIQPGPLNLMPMASDYQLTSDHMAIDQSFSVALTGYQEARLDSAVRRFLRNLSRRTRMPLTAQLSDPGSGQATHPHYFHIGPHARHAQQHRDLILARSRVTRRCRPTGLRRSAFQWVLHGPDKVCGATLRRRSDVRRYCRPDTGGEAAHSRRGGS